MPISLYALMSMLLNETEDFEFVKYFASVLIILFASYFVANILFYHGRYNFYDIIDLIKYACFLQVLIALVAFFMPFMRETMIKIQFWNSSQFDNFEDTLSYKLIGLGASFFVSGIIFSVALILITYKWQNKKMTSKEILIDILSYLFISVIGIFFARTTLVGVLFSVGMIIVSNKKQRVNKLSKTLPALLIIIPIMSFTYIKYVWNNPESERLVALGFELFINADEKGELSSGSTNRLLEMYETYPNDIKTFIIGDGYWVDPKGNGYYKHIDIGYFRLIYYFGLIGLFLSFLFEYKVIKMMQRSFIIPNYLVYILYFLLLVLNLKGFASLASMSLLFCFNSKENNLIKSVS